LTLTLSLTLALIKGHVHAHLAPDLGSSDSVRHALEVNEAALGLGAVDRARQEMELEATGYLKKKRDAQGRSKPTTYSSPARVLGTPKKKKGKGSSPVAQKTPGKEDMFKTPGFGSEAVPKWYPPVEGATMPGSCYSTFMDDYSISKRAARSLSQFGSPDVGTGSPVREVLQPKREGAGGKHTFIDRWGNKVEKEGQRWDQSGRKTLWFGERSQYRKSHMEKPRTAFEEQTANNFIKAMAKIRQKATAGNKFVVGGMKDANVDLQAVFDEMDEDGSGVIDTKEFVMGMLRIGIDLSTEELEAVFSFFDRDGGGIEFGELQWAFFNKSMLMKGEAGWAGTTQNKGEGAFSASHMESMRKELDAVRVKKKKEVDKRPLRDRIQDRPVTEKMAYGILKGIFDKIEANFELEDTDPIKRDLKSVFQEFDVDRSGKLNEEEFLEALHSMGIKISQHENKAVFAVFDKDGQGGGANKDIDYGEFVWTYFNRRTLGKSGGGGALNKKVDKTYDVKAIVAGVVDEELMAQDPLHKVGYISQDEHVKGDPTMMMFKRLMDEMEKGAVRYRKEIAMVQTKSNSFADAFETIGDEPIFRKVFEDLDTDDSGHLLIEEFAAFLDRYMMIDPEEVHELYAFLDRDGGGVEFGELMWLYRNRATLIRNASGKTKDESTKPNWWDARKRDLIERDPTYVVKTSLPKYEPVHPDGPVGLFLQSTDIIRDIATNHRKEKLVNLRKVFDMADTGKSGRVGRQELFVLFTKKGLMLTQHEFQSVYKYFDRDGGGIDYGEFCWVYYNRRVISEGTADWADASGAVQAKKKRVTKVMKPDARHQYMLSHKQREQSEIRDKRERIQSSNASFMTKQHAKANEVPKPADNRQHKPGWFPGGIYRSPLRDSVNDGIIRDAFDTETVTVEPIAPSPKKGHRRKNSWGDTKTPIEISEELLAHQEAETGAAASAEAPPAVDATTAK